MLKNFKSKVFLISLIALVGLALSPIYSPVTLVAGILLLASVAVFGLGPLARLVTAVFVYGIFGAFVIQITSLLHVQINFTVLSVGTLVLTYLYALRLKDKIKIQFTVMDCLGFLIGLTVFMFIALPLMGATTSKTLEYLLPGEDNNSHLMLYRYVLTHREYAYDNNSNQAFIRPSLISYAQGSHAAMAVITAPFVEHSSITDQLEAYVFTAAATFAATFWLGFLLISRPLTSLKSRRLQFMLGSISATVYGLSVPLGIFLALYSRGYYPENFSYLSLIFLLLVVTSAAETTIKKRSAYLIEFSALIIGLYAILVSWYLLIPMAITPVLAYLWMNREVLLKNKKLLFLVLILPLVICCYMLYVYLFTTYDGANHLFTTGGIDKMKARILVIGIPAVFMCIGALRKKKWFQSGFVLSLLAAVAMALFIGALQLKKLHHLDYYFYKSLYTVLLLAVLYYGYILMTFIADAFSSLRPEKLAHHPVNMLTLGILSTILVLAYYSPPAYIKNFIVLDYAITPSAPDRVLDIFTHPQIFNKYSDVIDLGSCNPYTNYTGILWSGTFFLPYNNERATLEDNVLTQASELVNYQPQVKTRNLLLTEIIDYAKYEPKPVAVEVTNQCSFSSNVISELSGAKNIQLVNASMQPYTATTD